MSVGPPLIVRKLEVAVVEQKLKRVSPQPLFQGIVMIGPYFGMTHRRAVCVAGRVCAGLFRNVSVVDPPKIALPVGPVAFGQALYGEAFGVLGIFIGDVVAFGIEGLFDQSCEGLPMTILAFNPCALSTAVNACEVLSGRYSPVSHANLFGTGARDLLPPLDPSEQAFRSRPELCDQKLFTEAVI